MNRWVCVLIAILSCNTVWAQDLSVIPNDLRDDFMNRAIRGASPLTLGESYRQMMARVLQMPEIAAVRPDWQSMFTPYMSAELASLFQDLSEQKAKPGHPSVEPQELILRHVLGAALRQLPFLPLIRERLPETVNPNMVVERDPAGGTRALVEMKIEWK